MDLKSSEIIEDIIQWDIQTWKKPLEYWENKVDWDKINLCLELGGRQGGLSLWLAQKGKQVICSDLQNVASTASALHHKYQSENFITYQDIDATNIPYENYFDLIVFKSIIGGIAVVDGITSQKKVFEEIYKALKPGGILLFAENLTASPLHQFARKKFNRWGSYWRYLTTNEIKIFLANYKDTTVETTGFLAAFGRSESQRNSLAVIDRLLFNRILPSNWHYVVYGVAKK
jgi:SAM-dependent methyltransferase